jgi:hypothetical protein
MVLASIWPPDAVTKSDIMPSEPLKITSALPLSDQAIFRSGPL